MGEYPGSNWYAFRINQDMDVSPYQVLKVQIRGEEGGENIVFQLLDETMDERTAKGFSRVITLSKDWEVIEVPLDALADNKGVITYINLAKIWALAGHYGKTYWGISLNTDNNNTIHINRIWFEKEGTSSPIISAVSSPVTSLLTWGRTLFLAIVVVIGMLKPVQAQTITQAQDPTRLGAVIEWMRADTSRLGMPKSFQVPEDQRRSVYSTMGSANSFDGVIERVIVNEGLVVYDGAVRDIVLANIGGEENLRIASIATNNYWLGRLGALARIRGGYDGSAEQPFVYNPDNPRAISTRTRGNRGFVFRIISAEGNYETYDPLDGKRSLNGQRIHWEDWKPIAGENAWLTMAASHLYHAKYYNPANDSYDRAPDNTVELSFCKRIMVV
jgi:hypothetical protein